MDDLAERWPVLVAKPRIFYSTGAGHYYCMSKHDEPTYISPVGVKIYHRIGGGETPALAYWSWETDR